MCQRNVISQKTWALRWEFTRIRINKIYLQKMAWWNIEVIKKKVSVNSSVRHSKQKQKIHNSIYRTSRFETGC